MNTITRSIAVAVLAFTSACSAHTVDKHSEQYARTATHLSGMVKYDGQYDDIDSKVRCFEGKPAMTVKVAGITAKHGYLVQYCTDGWVNVETVHGKPWVTKHA